MESNLSKEKRPSGDLHDAWHVAGWLGAMFAVLTESAAVVMARTHSVSVERSRRVTVAESGPRVLVTRPTTASARRQLTFPATIQGYVETPVFAKIAGYLKEIHVDKGDPVHKGQVLAILHSPELDAQVADANILSGFNRSLTRVVRDLYSNTESLNRPPTIRTALCCRHATLTHNWARCRRTRCLPHRSTES
jgi:multidrug efflux pump subunit AcrA (membrane-fusion protein)